MSMRRKYVMLGCVFVAAAALAVVTLSRSNGQATTRPTLTISPQTRQLLDQVRDAYASVKTLAVTGSIDGHFDIDGVKHTNTGKFDGVYTSSGLFRSEMQETSSESAATTQPTADAVLGNTGEKLYFYLPLKNRYLTATPPPGKVDLDKLGSDMGDVLRNQNLSLALALSGDAASEISQEASAITRADDQKIEGQSYPTLTVLYPRYDIALSIDPQTHLLRRAVADLSKNARLQGAQNVKTASLTIDYKNVPSASVDPGAFVWSPPPGAQLIAPESSAANLEGKPLLPFTLPGLDGKQVNSQSFVGSVVVLDFWATWCPTCIATLPELDGIYKNFKNQGVKVFAVNLQEEKDAVQKFINDTKLSIPVLMDSEGKVLSQYEPEAQLPFTMIIGKDGKVFKAGFLAADEQQMRTMIQDALKK
jgi:thiol-disulfide isomerase/thioredoxin